MKKIYLTVAMIATGLINFALLKALELHLVTQIASGTLTANDLWFLQGAKIAFPLWFQVFFVFLGVILGFPAGQRWWYVVYIEKRHWWFKMKEGKRNK